MGPKVIKRKLIPVHTDDHTRLQDTGISKNDEKQSATEADIAVLTNTVQDLSAEVKTLSAIVSEQKKIIIDLQNKVKKSTLWASQNEQYSRKQNTKISGLRLGNDSAPTAVTKFLKKELKIDVKNGDIDVAHLVKSRQAPKDS